MGIKAVNALILCNTTHWFAMTWEDFAENLKEGWEDALHFTFSCYDQKYMEDFIKDTTCNGTIMIFGDRTRETLYKEFFEYLMEEWWN